MSSENSSKIDKINIEDIFARIARLKKIQSKKDFATLFGLSPQNFSNREKRDTLMQVIVAWAINEGFSLDWLLRGEGSPHGETPIYKGVDPEDFEYIPMAKAELSAGSGAVVLSEGFKSRYAFRKDWLVAAGLHRGRGVMMAVRGDSMSPTLEDGDTVLVDTQKKRIFSGRIYAINTGDDLLAVKRLDTRGRDVLVISDNRQFYDPYKLPHDKVRVIGQVVWFARQLSSPDPENNGAVNGV